MVLGALLSAVGGCECNRARLDAAKTLDASSTPQLEASATSAPQVGFANANASRWLREMASQGGALRSAEALPTEIEVAARAFIGTRRLDWIAVLPGEREPIVAITHSEIRDGNVANTRLDRLESTGSGFSLGEGFPVDVRTEGGARGIQLDVDFDGKRDLVIYRRQDADPSDVGGLKNISHVMSVIGTKHARAGHVPVGRSYGKPGWIHPRYACWGMVEGRAAMLMLREYKVFAFQAMPAPTMTSRHYRWQIEAYVQDDEGKFPSRDIFAVVLGRSPSYSGLLRRWRKLLELGPHALPRFEGTGDFSSVFEQNLPLRLCPKPEDTALIVPFEALQIVDGKAFWNQELLLSGLSLTEEGARRAADVFKIQGLAPLGIAKIETASGLAASPN